MTKPNAHAPAPTASGTRPRAANGQQPLSLGLLAGTFRSLAATYGSSPLRRPASVGYRRGRSSRSGAKMQMQPACRSTSSTPRSQYLATRLRRQLLGVPRQLVQHGQQIPYGYRFSVRSGIAGGRVRGLDGQQRSLPPNVLNGAAGRGDTWGGLVSSPSRGGGHGRGWRPGSGGVGEGRQRHS